MDNIERINQDDLNERIRQSRIVQPLGTAANLTNELDKQLKPKYPEKSKNAPKSTDTPFQTHLDQEIAKDGSDPEEVGRNYAAKKAAKEATQDAERRQKAEQSAASRRQK